MKRIIYIDMNTNLVAYIGDQSLMQVTDGEIQGNYLLKIADAPEDTTLLFNTWHWDGAQFGLHAAKISDYQEWDPLGLKFIFPVNYLQLIANDNKQKINAFANDKILSKYPYHYQLNAPYDFGQDSPEVTDMRVWIGDIRAKANLAKAQLETLSLESEMDLVVKNFEKELGDIA
jgi:hypothetical protein